MGYCGITISETRNAIKPEKRTRKPRTRQTYTNYPIDQQIAAVTLLVQHGGLTYEGLAAARALLGADVAKSTFMHWIHKHGDDVKRELGIVPVDTAAIVAQTAVPIERTMGNSITKILQRLDDDTKLDSASVRDLAVTFGILEERLRLRLGLSPEALARQRRLDVLCTRLGYDPLSVMDDMLAALEREVSQPKSDVTIEASE